ncbi:MAG: TipAS antibiotic-recognition domain-containing protein [Lactobacillaceae bacterium]|jgi:hypothetical protein|nr:TipAS antibiotic-recognition domain-containing protein [Lactobacillaceae bacterium]
MNYEGNSNFVDQKLVEEVQKNKKSLNDETKRQILDINENILRLLANSRSDDKKIFQLHKEWLLLQYPKYSIEFHRALANVYENDGAFLSFYNKYSDNAGCRLINIIRKFTS